MSKSPNIGLTLTAESETEKRFMTFRTELSGEKEDSNMMIIDTEFGVLKEQCDKHDNTPFTWGMLKNGFKNK